MIEGDEEVNALTGNFLNNTIRGFDNNDLLDGGIGDDTLDGGRGEDTMIGGIGRDVYIVNSRQDVIQEEIVSLTEIDTVRSYVSYRLNDNVEDLILLGKRSSKGIGNELSNLLRGNGKDNKISGKEGTDLLLGQKGDDSLEGGSGGDFLTGGKGNDTLVGGSGKNQFRFNNPTEGVDTILDLVPERDAIAVDEDGFGSDLRLGRLRESRFAFASQEIESSTRFIYNQDTGRLLFDPDGSGETESIALLTLDNQANLNFSDLVVI